MQSEIKLSVVKLIAQAAFSCYNKMVAQTYFKLFADNWELFGIFRSECVLLCLRPPKQSIINLIHTGPMTQPLMFYTKEL